MTCLMFLTAWFEINECLLCIFFYICVMLLLSFYLHLVQQYSFYICESLSLCAKNTCIFTLLETRKFFA